MIIKVSLKQFQTQLSFTVGKRSLTLSCISCWTSFFKTTYYFLY